MARKNIKINLSNIKSIDDAINYLQGYEKDLKEKSELFVEKLASIGVSIAYQFSEGEDGTFGTHKMENYVHFTMSINPNKYGASAIVLGMGESFASSYVDANGVEHTEIVNPLLMLEFGSAGKALPPQERFGGYGGQGTMATQGHEKDLAWWYKDGLTGEWKLGTAITPTSPMLHAWEYMYANIRRCAREVWG